MAQKTSQIIGLGWDQPLEVDWDFQLPLLRREIKAAAPGSGPLSQAFDSPDTAVLTAPNEIDITVGRNHAAWPYAAIQEWGGPSHPVTIYPKREGGVLVFWWKGQKRFFSHVHMGIIRGQHFVERGVWSWWNKLRRGIGGARPPFSWRSKFYGTKVATRGRVSR